MYSEAASSSIRNLKNKKKVGVESPNLDFSSPQSSVEEKKSEGHIIDVVCFKKACHCSWCASCFVKRTVPKITKIMENMNWRAVRFITLTIDREKFENGQEAYETVKELKGIATMIKNLIRVQKLEIKNWLWWIEWHQDGYPHWHLLVETKEGRNGMIGGDLLRQYWGFGAVNESFIHNQGHWWSMTGYYNKHGYFDKNKTADKDSQSNLPEWALEYPKSIRRFGAMRQKKAELYGLDMSEMVEIKYSEKVRERIESEPCEECKQRSVYDVILRRCGLEVLVAVSCECVGLPMLRIKVPYDQFKKDNPDFEYVKGLGMYSRFNWDNLNKFLQFYRNDIRSIIIDDTEIDDFIE